ncbi:MAG: DUF309 domain-containing protein [Candidatus Marinimicrobia bacterium]|jgi:predicted metal-dependent hydrolase|nr:DUF309 domain-containing protein [Candidatus Neomarinimicrobiota bacterium]MBT3496955.1 DUF309 domain-containing protein [Candidatus Neomarinimicrobiota bacterium]MBT3692143.1 DUF309 domain-containing protein [Candidatus Neomarinimicrobiota bacterium]MBT3732963.1 DUF309 domain-containing protein [Candidatus Neomarinimicrobiota bacterium]MBT4143867.1 DUF309 domain-containing protein [Candidatus Neomarinimicrobiota bacterium]
MPHSPNQNSINVSTRSAANSSNKKAISAHPRSSADPYELKEFYLGVKAFNNSDYPKAHHIWEHSWMRQREDADRAYLKPFIMLAVSFQNYELGKFSGGDYLFETALKRLNQSSTTLDQWIDADLLIKQIQKSIANNKWIHRFENLKIKKRKTL